MEEIWVKIKQFDNLVEVSNLGNFRRLKREVFYKDGRKGFLKAGNLNGGIANSGYRIISFGNKKSLAHRIVAETFLMPPLKDYVYKTVNHINGNKLDNRIENLEWASYKENNKHARNTGLNKQHGENCNLTKYSDKFIGAIRNVYAIYNPSYAELGKIFDIDSCHAGQIVRNETRKIK